MATDQTMPSYGEVSRRLNAYLAAERNEWAGIPIPIPELKLTIEDRNPWKTKIDQLQAHQTVEDLAHAIERDGPAEPKDADDEDWLVRNTWWSSRLRREVVIIETVKEPVVYKSMVVGTNDWVRRFQLMFDTMRAATAWTVDTEATAQEKLAELIRPHLWEAYIHTGTFIESSKRSGLFYVFRRCRPTIAFNATTQKILACLCLHPVGYYQGTYAGSMCPTDDVIAHLMLMRGDEAMFWRRANQHNPERPEAGL